MQNSNQQNQKKGQKDFFGYYLMLDIYECAPQTVGDLKKCYNYLDELAEILKVEKLSPPFIVYTDEEKYPDKAGLSGWVPFVEPETKTFAGASIHTLTPTNFISIDVYSSKEFDREKIKEFTKKVFRPQKIEEQFVLRGEGFVPTKSQNDSS